RRDHRGGQRVLSPDPLDPPVQGEPFLLQIVREQQVPVHRPRRPRHIIVGTGRPEVFVLPLVLLTLVVGGRLVGGRARGVVVHHPAPHMARAGCSWPGCSCSGGSKPTCRCGCCRVGGSIWESRRGLPTGVFMRARSWPNRLAMNSVSSTPVLGWVLGSVCPIARNQSPLASLRSPASAAPRNATTSWQVVGSLILDPSGADS